jgi:hypothetical protein
MGDKNNHFPKPPWPVKLRLFLSVWPLVGPGCEIRARQQRAREASSTHKAQQLPHEIEPISLPVES